MGSVLGVQKAAAKRAGLNLEEYQGLLNSGQKRCTKCKQWKPLDHFGGDSTRSSKIDATCLICRRVKYKDIPTRLPEGPPKINARSAVKTAVLRGDLPPVRSLSCSRCGGKATQYHHFAGYEREHWLDVSPVCAKCHKAIHL